MRRARRRAPARPPAEVGARPAVRRERATISETQRFGLAQRLRLGGHRVGRWAPFRWALGVVALTMLDGLVGVLVGLVIGVELLLARSPRRLVAISLPCFAAVLLEDLLRGLPSESQVSAAWVADNLLANHLAFAGFAFLVAGLLLPERAAAPRSERPPLA